MSGKSESPAADMFRIPQSFLRDEVDSFFEHIPQADAAGQAR
jgi:hypothetical protein